ncbi:hypothetical protein D3C81_1688170 [compost metagenome]
MRERQTQHAGRRRITGENTSFAIDHQDAVFHIGNDQAIDRLLHMQGPTTTARQRFLLDQACRQPVDRKDNDEKSRAIQTYLRR